MSYEHVWALLGLLAIASWAAVAVWARHLRESKRLEVREMIHKERMAALERGMALADLPSDLADGTAPEDASNGGARWVERAALAAGLVLTLVGLGVGVGFALVPDTPEMGGMAALAALGVIPALAGVGLLLFWRIDRGMGGGR